MDREEFINGVMELAKQFSTIDGESLKALESSANRLYSLIEESPKEKNLTEENARRVIGAFLVGYTAGKLEEKERNESRYPWPSKRSVFYKSRLTE